MMKKVLLILMCVGALAPFDAALSDETTRQKSVFANLPEETREKVRDLARRIREQQAKLWSLPDSATLIRADDELKVFCTTSDLVEILGCDDHTLREAAFHLLLGLHNNTLTAENIERLGKYLSIEDPKEDWRGTWAGRVLVQNEALGIPALVNILRNTRNQFARVHAAGALAERDAKTEPGVRRDAKQVLLKALGNADDSGRLAHNAVQPLEPWMVDWLTKTLPVTEIDSALWPHGTSVLAAADSQGYEDALRTVFLAALQNPSVNARMNGVNGLRHLGFKMEDLPLYQRIQKDDNPHVRRMLYAGLKDKGAPWMVPLLMDGLEDTLGENVEICAGGLSAMRHRAAVPKLVEILKKAPTDESIPFDSPYRSVGEAIAKLTDQTFDFALQTHPEGNRHILAYVIDNRGAVYQTEAARVLRWWQDTGSKEKW